MGEAPRAVEAGRAICSRTGALFRSGYGRRRPVARQKVAAGGGGGVAGKEVGWPAHTAGGRGWRSFGCPGERPAALRVAPRKLKVSLHGAQQNTRTGVLTYQGTVPGERRERS